MPGRPSRPCGRGRIRLSQVVGQGGSASSAHAPHDTDCQAIALWTGPCPAAGRR
ncbi:hypothetical protein PACID_24330 [Acidipropionibacterium acidipropionici ATCC 4875]|uniref:Uncharacterized protein n=1 Tax=Acidipropionibacterium acidipropionici (strain ATCC 4875 / DSM 20272 / JCM 6432 / NBRC 12425 / NCIMB 8070 / 4) TaxID=1171373 RepID=K7RQA0_ACIA4|nr:hypothetical protein PACID_24330 [Acidipropionibacterium acidipropionici ATCC 4875]